MQYIIYIHIIHILLRYFIDYDKIDFINTPIHINKAVMPEREELVKFINKLNDNELLDFLVQLNNISWLYSEIEEINPEWKAIIDYNSCEYILYALSLMSNEKILSLKINRIVDKLPISNFTVNDLEKDGITFNRDSVLMINFPVDNDYLTYKYLNENELDMDSREINMFMVKYGIPEEFDSDTNRVLALLKYELEHVREFIFQEEGELDRYEMKHFKIKIFFQVWNMYKKIKPIDKERFLENVIKKHFVNINWMTVSRLYNVNDMEFCDIFGDYIDEDFASKYNKSYQEKYTTPAH